VQAVQWSVHVIDGRKETSYTFHMFSLRSIYCYATHEY